jgi:hypothetical protein
LNPTLIASFLGNDSAYSESYAQIILLRQQSPIICAKYLVAGMLGGTKWASIHHKSGSFVVDPIAKELNPSLEASPRLDKPTSSGISTFNGQVIRQPQGLGANPKYWMKA